MNHFLPTCLSLKKDKKVAIDTVICRLLNIVLLLSPQKNNKMTHCSMRFRYGLDLCILKQGNMYFINIVFGSIFLVDLDTLCWINVEDCFTISTLFFYLVIVVFYCVEGHYLKNGHYVTLYIKKCNC